MWGCSISSFSRREKKSYLGPENGRLDQLERAAVDLDQTLAGLALSDSLFQFLNRQQSCTRRSSIVDRFRGAGSRCVGVHEQSRFSSCRSTGPSEEQPWLRC